MVPGLHPDYAGAAQELTFGRVLVGKSSRRFSGPLPLPLDPPAGRSPANPTVEPQLHLLNVSALRISAGSLDKDPRATLSVDLCPSRSLKSLVVDGQLEWETPDDSQWAIVATYRRGTAQTKSSYEFNDNSFCAPIGGVVDHFSKEGVDVVKVRASKRPPRSSRRWISLADSFCPPAELVRERARLARASRALCQGQGQPLRRCVATFASLSRSPRI